VANANDTGPGYVGDFMGVNLKLSSNRIELCKVVLV